LGKRRPQVGILDHDEVNGEGGGERGCIRSRLVVKKGGAEGEDSSGSGFLENEDDGEEDYRRRVASWYWKTCEGGGRRKAQDGEGK